MQCRPAAVGQSLQVPNTPLPKLPPEFLIDASRSRFIFQFNEWHSIFSITVAPLLQLTPRQLTCLTLKMARIYQAM